MPDPMQQVTVGARDGIFRDCLGQQALTPWRFIK